MTNLYAKAAPLAQGAHTLLTDMTAAMLNPVGTLMAPASVKAAPLASPRQHEARPMQRHGNLLAATLGQR